MNSGFEMMMKYRHRMMLILLVLCLTWAGAAGAQEAAGSLTLLRGKVKIIRKPKSIVMTVPQQTVAIFVGDVLHSGSTARATISLRDSEDTVALFPSTRFVVNAVTPSRSAFRLNIGKVLFSVIRRVTGAQRSFSVKTATATLGVKGTEFIVGTDGQTTYLLTISGLVGIVNNVFLEQEVVTSLNQASVARRNEVPTPPIQITDADRESIVEEDGLDTFQSLPFASEQEKKQSG